MIIAFKFSTSYMDFKLNDYGLKDRILLVTYFVYWYDFV